ncbi:AER222Cp [Eremothecium gossypii ATCC 10895]|uniref:non-specific serine/threonine protein kinase n=1 Tax=Eremothecium gossypii (strain ATCC 10895 / CBS 109.51 / FGSC 9923 / NRRL Y-1056) TaxID=284811 RepID=Q756N2_EREGS|nr:AER222Cp [Eremothecium gossypii ATCC 10895]AAS52903.1 AER222Cp [Eremothecium gossypii ATCC 10895]AEY97211.1 FAER222Cp [Eremothecium gossypii FDAG1]
MSQSRGIRRLQTSSYPQKLGHSQPNEFKVLEEIGRGSFGSVRKVLHVPTSKLMVRKEIKYGHMNSKERQQLIAECTILAGLRHENIVEFYNWDHASSRTGNSVDYGNGEVLYLYMEYCSCGDLSQMIKHYKGMRKYVPERDIWRIAVQLLLALYKCHTSCDLPQLDTIYDKISKSAIESEAGKVTSVIHRDLKPGNIFLTGDGVGGRGSVDYSKVEVKLGDFGLAKSLQSAIEFATTYVGTPYYMSPEVLMDQPYSPLSDIWSLGCVIYELCALRVPFPARNFMELQRMIQRADVQPLPDYYSKELQQLVISCINPNEKLRPSAFDLLQCLQLRVARKALQLERFEKNLLVYEKELTEIGEMLEKQASDYDKEINDMRTQCRKDFELAVEKRARELVSGKRIQDVPDIHARYHVRTPTNPWRS